jgi:hypothetical protein
VIVTVPVPPTKVPVPEVELESLIVKIPVLLLLQLETADEVKETVVPAGEVARLKTLPLVHEVQVTVVGVCPTVTDT